MPELKTDRLERTSYIGDGLYVFYNGFSFELSVNDHRNPPCAVFEREHINHFIQFANRMIEKKEKGEL